MIVPMKKITLVVLESKRREAVESLRRLGLVHPEGLSGSSKDLEENEEKAARLGKALLLLPADKKKTKPAAAYDQAAALSKASEIIKTAEEIKARKDELEKLGREYERLEPWGDFDVSALEEIPKAGFRIMLYEVPAERMKNFSSEAKTFVVYRRKKIVGAACLAKDDAHFPKGFESFPLPARSLSQVDALRKENETAAAALEEKLASYASARAELLAAAEDAAVTIEFERVAAGMAREERIVYLSGYIPAPRTEDAKKAAAENGWGLLLRDPSPDDAVPTLVQNPRWIRIIQPIFDFLGVAPGYREVDISMFFLVFFVFFFAMIVGDAGYGCLFFGVSFFFYLKERKTFGHVSNATILLLLLNFATIVWGAVTGVWFGSTALNKHPLLAWMVIPRLDGFVNENADLIKLISFNIGLVHLTIAHVWNFLRELKNSPFLKALAQIGWMLMLWGLYFFVLFFVLDSKKYPIPPYAAPMILAGYLMVLFLGQQQGDGFVKGIVRGLAGFITTTLSSISVFADVISYIRLFAVGLATVEIAKSFNSMAAGMDSLGLLGLIPMVLILIVGHGLNMAMAALSVIVHGVRLNLLEFSGHLGLEWAGNPYRPFKEKIKIIL